MQRTIESIVIRKSAPLLAVHANKGLAMKPYEAIPIADLLLSPEALCDTQKTVMEYYYKGQNFAQLFEKLSLSDRGRENLKKLYEAYNESLAVDDRIAVDKIVIGYSAVTNITAATSVCYDKSAIAIRKSAALMAVHANTGLPMTEFEAIEIARVLLINRASCDPQRTAIEYYYRKQNFAQLFKQLSKTENGRELLGSLYHDYRYGDFIVREDKESIKPYFEKEIYPDKKDKPKQKGLSDFLYSS